MRTITIVSLWGISLVIASFQVQASTEEERAKNAALRCIEKQVAEDVNNQHFKSDNAERRCAKLIDAWVVQLPESLRPQLRAAMITATQKALTMAEQSPEVAKLRKDKK